VDAHAATLNPNSRALLSAIETTRSLNEFVGVARVVLDPHLTEPELGREAVGAHEGRETRPEVDRRIGGDRKQICVPPEARRARGDALAADDAGDRLVVVRDLERTETPFARVNGRYFEFTTALSAAQTQDVDSRRRLRRSQVTSDDLLAGCSRRALEHLERRPLFGNSSVRHWHLARTSDSLRESAARAGCRGVNGPVPRPLLMSAYFEAQDSRGRGGAHRGSP
jgi:hypothetical protein